MERKKPKFRFPIMALGGLALILALWGGLFRLGWNLPVIRPSLLFMVLSWFQVFWEHLLVSSER